MQKYSDKIKECKLFNGINPEDSSVMLNCLDATVKSYDKKETVYSEGIILKKIGIVLEGKLQVVQYDYMGNRTILSALEPMQIFGEAFSYVGNIFPYNIETLEKTKIMFLNPVKISNPCERVCGFHRILVNNLLGILANKSVNLSQKIECMSKRTTREKILAFLSSESLKNNSKEFYIDYNRQELADYLGVERSAMSVEISKLRSEGILKSDKNHFILC